MVNNEPTLEELLSFMDGETPPMDPNSEDPNKEKSEGEEEKTPDDEQQIDDDGTKNPDEGEGESSNRTSKESNLSETDDEETDDEEEASGIEDDDSDEDSSDNDGDGAPLDLKAYYNVLVEDQVLFPDEDFEFDGTTEGLVKAQEQTRKNIQAALAQDMFNKLPDDFKPLLIYGLNGGTDIKPYLETFKTKELEDLNPENPADQRMIMKEYYKRTTKYDDAKINRMIARLEATDDLETEAVDTIEELKELDKAERERLAQEAEQQKIAREQAAEANRQKIMSMIDDIDSIPKEKKGKVKAFMFNPVKIGDEVDTNLNRTLKTIASKEEHLVQLANFLLDNYDPKEGLTLEQVSKKAKVKATKSVRDKLDSLVSNPKTKVSGKNTKSKINDPNFDWETFLKG